MRRVLVGLVLVAAIVALVQLSRGTERNETPLAGSAALLNQAAAELPDPRTPAFRIRQPELLDPHEARSRFAPVTRRVVARAEPRRDAEPVTTLERRTEDGTANIVLILREAMRQNESWIQVSLAALPNGQIGWVPRSALGGYGFVRTRLVVDRARLTATLLENEKPIFEAPVGIGTPEAPTPAGEFYVRLKLAGFDDPFYGPIAFGTSARSAVLTDWPGGGYIGIHGTHAPELIPGRVSHGCVRLRNHDIVTLSRLMPVGTPLTIR